jgi:hypothetical protein
VLSTSSTRYWKYKNKLAKAEGGGFLLKIISKIDKRNCAGGLQSESSCVIDNDCPGGGTCAGYYKFGLKAYGDAETAEADMKTEVVAGDDSWAVRGLWIELSKGWKLNKKSVFLDPWL